MQEKIWESTEELLTLFSVDISSPGAVDFCALVAASALLLQFPELQCGTWAVATAYMRSRKWSPVVYWSRQKKAVKELLETDDDVLEGLGIVMGEKRTVYALAHAVASVLAQSGGGSYEDALKLKNSVEGGVFVG